MRKVFAVVVGLGLLVLGVVFVAVPAEWSVKGKIVTHAAPRDIHAYLDSPAKYRDWIEGGYLKSLESFTTSGPPTGVGAAASWTSGSWSHRVTITKSEAEGGVWFDEALGQPTNNGVGSITFAPVKGGTRVTWESRGKLSFWQRLSSPFLGFNLKPYTMGALQNLKRVVESGD